MNDSVRPCDVLELDFESGTYTIKVSMDDYALFTYDISDPEHCNLCCVIHDVYWAYQEEIDAG